MNKKTHRNPFKNHSLAMSICCALPLTLFVLLSLSGVLGSWGLYALLFLCPVLHLFMMRGRTRSHCAAQKNAQVAEDEEELFLSTDITNTQRQLRRVPIERSKGGA